MIPQKLMYLYQVVISDSSVYNVVATSQESAFALVRDVRSKNEITLDVTKFQRVVRIDAIEE